jgi:P-type E1-E2 ATPase
MAAARQAEVLRLAASLDQASKHIIAQTIVSEAQDRGLRLAVPTNVIETSGEGIAGSVEGRRVIIGGVHYVTSKLASRGPALQSVGAPGSIIVAIAIDGQLASELVLADELRAGTEALLHDLRHLDVERIVLATGDRREVAEAITAGLSIETVRSDLTPDQKVMAVLSERMEW